MDPLSIAASTITLIQAAGAVSSTLYEFVATFRNADARVQALCTQLSRLIKFLEAVDRILRKCRRPLSLASIDEDLWTQGALSLEDCKTTLDELATFVNRIKAIAKSPGLFRRAKVAMDLTIYAGDITGFEEKIHKSNWALQTMLSAIQVSLSLRGNETQDKILYELGRLKSSIEQSIQASFHHSDGFSHTLEDPSDARIAYNLQKLARAAQNFHSSASTTASTIYGGNGTLSWNLQSDAAMSIMGGANLTPNKRQQVDLFVKQQRRMTLRRQRKPLQHVASSASASASIVRPSTPDAVPAVSSEESQETESIVSEMADDHDEGEDEAEFQSFLLSGLEEVAKDSMLNQDFAKAQSMLEEAIQRRTGSNSEDVDFKQLQVQLAICYFFQHKWHLAEPLIDGIAKSKANFDPVICNLLHALAIANLGAKRFEKAIVVCKQALYGKRRLKRDFEETFETECNETLGLLATIHDLQGNRLDAEGLRRKVSKEFSYYHPENELEFIVIHPKLCMEVFGKKITLDWRRPQPQIPVVNTHPVTEYPVVELPAHVPTDTGLAPIKEENTSRTGRQSKKPLQTFHTRLNLYERTYMDSAKEVVGQSPSYVLDNEGLQPWNSLWNDPSGKSSSKPGMSAKLSLKKRIHRFLCILKERPAEYGDDWSTGPFLDAGDTHEHPEPKLVKGFWWKGNNQIFKLRKPKRKLRKRTSQGDENNMAAVRHTAGPQQWLSAQGQSIHPPIYEGPSDSESRPWRLGVDAWLRTSSGYPQKSNPRYSNLFPDAAYSSDQWVPASQILQTGVETTVRNVSELADTSVSRYIPYRPIERFVPVRTPGRRGFREFTTMIDNSSENQGGINVNAPSFKTKNSKSPPSTILPGRRLTVATPKSGENAEDIPLAAHHLRMNPESPIVESVKRIESSSTLPVASSSSLESTAPTEAGVVAPVSKEFKVDNADDLAVKERLEREFDEFMQKATQDPFFGESRGRKSWVPASYFKNSPLTSTTMGGSMNHASQNSQDQNLEVKKRPLASNMKDILSHGFHHEIKNSLSLGSYDAIRQRQMIMERSRYDLPKPRYELVDQVAGENAKPPMRLERAQKRPSMPKLPAIDPTQSSQQIIPALKTHVDLGPASPCLPPQALGRKFSWESVFGEENIFNAPIQTDPEPAVPLLPQIKSVTRKLSGCSDNSDNSDQQIPTPDLVRSSSLSSSFSFSTASTSSSASSAPLISTGKMLNYDSVVKDPIIISNDSTSSLVEVHSLDTFVEQLSAIFLEKESKSCSTTTPPAISNVEIKSKHGDETSSVETKDTGDPPILQVTAQASEASEELSSVRPTDIFQRILGDEEKKKNLISDWTNGIINRQHPLHEKKRRRKMKNAMGSNKHVDKEKQMLYPGGTSPFGALEISFAA